MNPLLPFLMAGDPSLEALPKLLSEAKALGLEAIELGLPHSDPIADGPVLQAAAHRAIARGATPVIGSALVQELADGRSLREALASRMVDDA